MYFSFITKISVHLDSLFLLFIEINKTKYLQLYSGGHIERDRPISKIGIFVIEEHDKMSIFRYLKKKLREKHKQNRKKKKTQKRKGPVKI